MNVANLLLERGTSRGKEMAVRASLGAGRARLVRQMLTESLLLSFLGAGLGLLLAYAGVRFAVYTSPQYAIPRADEISINLRMLGFTLLVALLTGWLFGLFPALRASKPDLTESLKEGGLGPVAHLGGRRIQRCAGDRPDCVVTGAAGRRRAHDSQCSGANCVQALVSTQIIWRRSAIQLSRGDYRKSG